MNEERTVSLPMPSNVDHLVRRVLVRLSVELRNVPRAEESQFE